MGKLDRKTAIVTGAARGIGHAIAVRFVAEGARVMLADRDGEAVAAAATALGQEALTVDVGVKSDIETMVARTLRAFGDIDILVNNAGIFHAAGLLDLTEPDFDRVMAVNVKSVLFATQAVAPHMIARKSGSVVNIASLAATLGADGAVAYCVSKAAVVQLTNVSAIALAPHGVRVNAIGPGTFLTDMARKVYGEKETQRVLSRTPMGRLGEPSEVAGIAVFLASDDASYVTGKTIYADGGRLGLNLTMPTEV